MRALLRAPARSRWPSLLLLAVCVLHGVSSLVLVGMHHGLGWDETVYLSQINRFVPAGVWSPPRARGLTLLVAPVTLATPSLAATRLWLAALTSLLMYVGFRPWLRLVRPYAVPLAALLLSALWQTVYYGGEAMPNLFVATFAVPAVALTVLHLREPERWQRLAWIAVLLAAIALVRPSDAVYAGVPLAVAALARRGLPWRPRLLAAGAVAVGAAAGIAQWVVEAYTSFDGPLNRYHRAIDEQGGSGLHFSLWLHARTLAGPLLCRDGCDPHPAWWVMAWWFVLPALVAAGLVLCRRRDRLPLGLAVVTGLALAAEYVVGIGYSAPRFLLPTYALLLLAAAAALVEAVVRLPASAGRTAVAAAIGAVVVAHAVTQAAVLRRDVLPPNNRGLAAWAAQAWVLRHEVLGPGDCVVAGPASAPVAYDARCKGVSQTSMRTETYPTSTMRVFISRTRIITPASWLRGWQELLLRLPGGRGHVWAYLPPGEQPRGSLAAG